MKTIKLSMTCGSVVLTFSSSTGVPLKPDADTFGRIEKILLEDLGALRSKLEAECNKEGSTFKSDFVPVCLN